MVTKWLKFTSVMVAQFQHPLASLLLEAQRLYSYNTPLELTASIAIYLWHLEVNRCLKAQTNYRASEKS